MHQTQAMSFPVRAASSAQCFPHHHPKPTGQIPLPLCPPSHLPAVRPAPFPGDCGKGGGRGRRSLSLSFSSGSWRCSWAPLELVLRRSSSPLQLLSWRSCLSRSVLIFGEGEVVVWGKSLRPSQGSPVCTVESTLVRSCWFFFRSVVLHWAFRGGKMVFNKLVVQRRMAVIWEFGRRADLTVSVL